MNEQQQIAAVMAQIYPVILVALAVEGRRSSRYLQETVFRRYAWIAGCLRVAGFVACLFGLLQALAGMTGAVDYKQQTIPDVALQNAIALVICFSAVLIPQLLPKKPDGDSNQDD